MPGVEVLVGQLWILEGASLAYKRKFDLNYIYRFTVFFMIDTVFYDKLLIPYDFFRHPN